MTKHTPYMHKARFSVSGAIEIWLLLFVGSAHFLHPLAYYQKCGKHNHKEFLYQVPLKVSFYYLCAHPNLSPN
jgi:hypothetical protein